MLSDKDVKKYSEAARQRIADVVAVIDSDSTYAVKQEFSIKSDNDYRIALPFGIGAGLILLLLDVINGSSSVITGVVLILAVIALTYALFRSDRIAAVSGDLLTVKKKKWPVTIISKAVAYGNSYLYVYSNNKKILKLVMSSKDCAEFAKWLKNNGVPIEKTSDRDIARLTKVKLALTAGVFIIFAAFLLHYAI